MTSELQDRIARAIYESRNGAGCVPWSCRDGQHKAPYLDDAAAALKVIAATPTMSAVEIALASGGTNAGR